MFFLFSYTGDGVVVGCCCGVKGDEGLSGGG